MSKIIVVPIIVIAILLSLIPPNFQVSAISLDIEDSPNDIKLESDKNAQLYFVENRGQLNNGKDVEFYVQSKGFRAYFERETITYQFIYSEGNESKSYSLKQHFIDSSAEEISGMGKREAVFNYFSGNDPERWHSNVPTYTGILYEEVYPNTDLEFIGSGDSIKYNFLVEDNPEIISFAYEGQSGLEIDKNGDLLIKTPIGTLREKSPYAYQIINGEKVEVGCKYIIENGIVSFAVEEYNQDYPLVIDPLIEWSTYLGGSNWDVGYGIAVENGFVYVTGDTRASDFPTTAGAFDRNYDDALDIFVTKLNSDCSSIVYSTYINSTLSRDDHSESIDVENGCAYITGWTYSDYGLNNGFPTTSGAFRTVHRGRGSDAFITKLSQDGSSLEYSTFIGGLDGGDNGADYAYDIKVSNGMAYITGWTYCSDFPRTHLCYSGANFSGGIDSFISVINPQGNGESDLVYSTLIGESSMSWSIDVQNGIIYIGGYTSSNQFPTTSGAYDRTHNGHNDIFIFKLTPAGNQKNDLLYSTYIGGDGSDPAYDLSVDNGIVYITGGTYSTNFPTSANAYDSTLNGSWDSFVVALNPQGNGASDLIYSTYLGGGNNEIGYGIRSVDNSIIVSGYTMSPNFPLTPDALDNTLDGTDDIFLTKISSDGTISYSSMVGGSSPEGSLDMATENNYVYLVGSVTSNNFPVTNGAYDTSYNGGTDAFILKTNLVSGWNERPSVIENFDEAGTKSGNILFPYTLTDAESNPCSISMEYYYSGSWNSATQGTGSDGISGLSSSPSGVSHNFIWNSTNDIGSIYAESIKIRIKANDGALDSEWEETGSFTVNNNSAPTISDILNQITNEDTPIGPISFTVGDAETPASNLQVSASSSNHALVTDANISLGGSSQNRTITITPLADQHGSTTITVTVSDGIASSSDTFTLTVNSSNDLPIATDDSSTVYEDSTDNEIDALQNDSDPENDQLTIISLSDPANGTATIINAGKLIYYSPDPDFTGADSFTYKISDGNNGEATATVTVTVTNVNDGPRVIEKFEENGVKARDILVPYALIDNDSDPCSITVQYYELGIWKNATPGQEGDGTVNLSSSPEGFDHLFVWDSKEDIKYKHYSIVKLRIKANDGDIDSPWVETDYFLVKNKPIDVGQIFNNLVVYRLNKVNELLSMINNLYPEGLPADARQKLVLAQQHVDIANSTESPVKSAYELMEAIKILKEILEFSD